MDIALVNWKELLQEIYHWPYFCEAIIAIIFLLFIWRIIRKRRSVINLSTHEEGKVSVMRSALINLIENTCNNIAPDSKPRVCLCEKNGKLNFKIKIRVFSDQHIENTTSLIQKEINYVLQDTLGLDNIGTINILIAGFRKASNKASINTSTYSDTEIDS